MMKEFLDANKHLSAQTVKQYTSALRIFFTYVKNELGNRPLYLIKKRDFIKYFGFLQDNGLSSSALKFKRSAVSTLCKYVEKIVVEEEEDYKKDWRYFEAVKEVAGAITPVPGGVGLLTVAMLMQNVVRAAEMQAGK